MNKRRDIFIHAVLLIFLGLTMLPFVFVVNNSLRSQTEQYRDFFGVPSAAVDALRFTLYRVTGKQADIKVQVRADVPISGAAAGAEAAEEAVAELDSTRTRYELRAMPYAGAMKLLWQSLTRGYKTAWKDLRPYVINTFIVAMATVAGVLLLGSVSGYIFSRYHFAGRGLLFAVLLSIIMIPPVLTLVPAFLLVKKLQLLNSYWVLILPYIAGGQIVAIFLFKSFFDGLPEELFESARLEGAGHFTLYRHIVLPLSAQVAAVVAVMNILGVWNNFMWPFITNTDPKYHVIASGLFLMQDSATGQNFSAMYAAFVLSSIPLVILFVYATRPFLQGVTSGAFKA